MANSGGRPTGMAAGAAGGRGGSQQAGDTQHPGVPAEAVRLPPAGLQLPGVHRGDKVGLK